MMTISYWVSTTLLTLILSLSAASYLWSAAAIAGIKALGFPDHFRVMLAVLKLLAALIIILPVVPLPVKDWAYAGAFFFFITAIVAHFAHRDPIALNLLNLFFIALLFISYYLTHKLSVYG